MTRKPTVEELVEENTNSDDENVENWNNTMVGEFLDDSEDEDRNNLELYSSKDEKKEKNNFYLFIILNFLYHKISPCLVLPCDMLP